MVKLVWFTFQQCLVPLTCCFPKGPLKGDLSETFLTTFFRVCNFANTSAMTVIFFKIVQNFILVSKMQKQIHKMSFASEIIASELAVLNCLY